MIMYKSVATLTSCIWYFTYQTSMWQPKDQ